MVSLGRLEPATGRVYPESGKQEAEGSLPICTNFKFTSRIHFGTVFNGFWV